jgi:sugar O-acyltransferase (sialic acid O-acetyltransferase NeuD family)
MNLTILGFSEATLTMIMDCMDSVSSKCNITIVNNLNIVPRHSFENINHNITFVESIPFESHNLVIGVTNPIHKYKIFEVFELKNKKTRSIIHKNTSISITSNVGYGCIINPNVSIASFTTIGNFVSINRNVSIGHHTIIKDFITINPGVNIAGHVVIGDGTTIGLGTNVINNVNIGKNCIIGAGSLVNKDIPDNSVAWGSPCKIIRKNVTHNYTSV